MKPPVIRWPGGCFADDYHWQDGIGPRAERPRRINIHWGEVIETNQVGTQAFVHLCRLVGAEPYICGNVGSGSVRELRDWIEYCNFPGDSTWAQQRALVETPDIGYTQAGKDSRLSLVSGSASIKDQAIFLTLTNTHAAQEVDLAVELLGGATAESAEGRILTGEIHTHNTFDAPETIIPVPLAIITRGEQIHLTLPPASVAALQVHLA